MNKSLQTQVGLINCQENQMDGHQANQLSAVAAYSLANLGEGAPQPAVTIGAFENLGS
jgi:hypothetical protein